MIILNAFENVAYWWTLRIKELVDSIALKGYGTVDEVDFVTPFLEFNLDDYRSMYLELTNKIKEKFDSDGFYVETTSPYRDGHAFLNSYLKGLLKVDIPNTAITKQGKNNVEISIIKIKNEKIVSIITWNDIMRDLETEHQEDFILTGDKKYRYCNSR